MKRLLTYLLTAFLLIFISGNASATLPDGSTAPNFIMTDIDGTTHTLYDYLDAGKTVILDFSATWCPNCWTYHNSGALEDIYNDHGPSGDNTMMVFMIERDPTTTLADLNGTGVNTWGDWTDKPYPIFNPTNEVVVDAYDVVYQPVIYMICPDYTTYEIGTDTATEIEDQVASICGASSSSALSAKAFLEGSVNGTNSMTTGLGSLVPNDQPFDTAPWNYNGSESISSVPSNAVDWVLVELRSDLNTTIEQKAGLLLDNGDIVDHDNPANGALSFGAASGSYYVVVRARGHLDVLSASSISLPNSSAYNFGSSVSQAYGTDQLKLVSGTYALHSGDADGDGIMTIDDFNLYINDPSAINQYRAWDYNLDGQVTIADYNLYRVNSSVLGVNEIRY